MKREKHSSLWKPFLGHLQSKHCDIYIYDTKKKKLRAFFLVIKKRKRFDYHSKQEKPRVFFLKQLEARQGISRSRTSPYISHTLLENESYRD